MCTVQITLHVAQSHSLVCLHSVSAAFIIFVVLGQELMYMAWYAMYSISVQTKKAGEHWTNAVTTHTAKQGLQTWLCKTMG